MVSFVHVCRAQTSVTPEDEYKKLIKVDQDIEPLGAHPFGEQISLYDGSLSFEETDISLAGNGPTIRLSRSFQTAESPAYSFNAQRPFGDWDLDIPRIETISADQGNVTGWETSSLTNYRCSFFSAPPSVSPSQPGADSWGASQWWNGYHLVVPGEGSQELLARDVQNNPLSPTISGQTFSIVTKQNWMISCGVSTDNQTADPGGEGFMALAPDGTRYTFNHLVYRPMPNITSPLGTPPMAANVAMGIHPDVATSNILYRRDALMYVTQVQDRFGNTLTYNYSGNNLASITASDGRQLTVTYVSGTPRIQTVTAHSSDAPARTWTYSYDTSNSNMPNLTTVQLPNGSAWSYSLGLQSAQIVTEGGRCFDSSLPILESGAYTGTITHPSGLTATFTVTPTLHGRSYVPKQCWGDVASGSQPTYSIYPDTYYQLSLTKETISGPGIVSSAGPFQAWTYSYSPSNQSWSTDACAIAGTCPSTVYTDVVDPEGHDVRSTFSNRFDVSEGLLQRTDYFASSNTSAVLRSEINTYANAVGGPWPTSYGIDLQNRDNHAQTTEQSPLSLKQTLQDGDTYSWQAESFNAYTQVTKAKRSNLIAGQSALEETTSYLNDTNLWVLGLPLQVTNVTPSGPAEVESTNTYAANDTLLTRTRFGQLLMSYGWNTAGQLTSFTDPLNHTTTLGNYKRGIPQSIGFPDSTSESLVVDDFGQISSITNQAGNTTSYLYDSIGRIAEIDYPTGDTVAWAKQTFTYSFETWVSHGLEAGHWLRSVTQGPKVAYTYFDAMMRPREVLTRRSSDGGAPITSRIDYDSRGNKIFQSYAIDGNLDLSGLTAGITTNYDALSRVTSTVQPSELGNLTTTTNYLSGARKQVIDPKGNSTTASYQVFDEPSYDNVIQVSAPEGVIQTILRDIYGNPHSITQSGGGVTPVKKTMAYDGYHRLCRTTEPESGSEVMAYDAANNLAWSASGQAISGTDDDCGQTQVTAAAQTVRGYDAMNRVTAITYPAGTAATAMTYTLTGKPHTATSGAVSWTYGYNKLDLLTAEGLSVDGYSWALGYGYDVNGVLASTVYPDGKAVTYSPDFLGRPTTAGSYAAGATYYPDGDLQAFTFGSGAAYTAAENSRNLLASFSYGTGSAVAVSEDLTYDGNANITQVCDVATSTKPCNDPTNDGLRTKTLGYDGLNRLTSANAANLWGTESYTYDTLNNIRTLTTAGVTNTYNYDAGTNRLTSVMSGATTVSSFGYDTRGNVTLRNSVPMVFDEANRLTQINNLDSYTYDAQGRRVKKFPVSGTPTYYAYNQAGQLMWQYDLATTNGTDYIYLGKKMVASTVNADTTVIGNIDGVTTGTTATVTGWACSTGLPQSIQVGVYEGPAGTGANIAFVVANQSSETAINAQCKSTGTAYRFSAVLSDSVRQTYPGQPIYAYGASPVGNGDNMLTQSGVFTIPASVNAPPAPAVLNASAAADFNSINLSWSSAATATSYTLQESYNGGSWVAYYTGSATSLNAPVSADGTYAWRVEACNTNGCSVFTSGPTVTIIHTPTVPAAISVPATSTGPIAIGWSTTTYQTFYSLEQSFNGGAFAAIYNGAANAFSYTATSTGTYTYRVRACNASVCGGYGPSGSSTITIPPTQAPNIAVPATSNTGSYTVNWGGFAGMTSYVMQEQVNGGAWATIANNGSGTLNISGKGSGTYGYRVQGCNAGGCGPWSATATIAVTRIPAVPNTPALSVTGPSNKPVVHANWTAVAFATSYHVEETNPDGTTTVSNVTTTTASQLVLETGTVKYRIEACNVAGCSAYSGYGSTTVQGGL